MSAVASEWYCRNTTFVKDGEPDVIGVGERLKVVSVKSGDPTTGVPALTSLIGELFW